MEKDPGFLWFSKLLVKYFSIRSVNVHVYSLFYDCV